MSQIGLGMHPDPKDPHDPVHEDPHPGADPAGRDPHRRSRFRGCLPVVLVVLVVGALLLVAGRWAYNEVSSRFAASPDYSGPGHGKVLYEVQEGATSAQIARDLKQKDVVKSVDAFTDAARSNENSRNIQVGYYQLKKQMKAAEALETLVNPDNLMQSLVVVREGGRVSDIISEIVDKTDITRKQLSRALQDGAAIGLPPEANGNPEGYLFPATYTVPPKQDAVGLLRQMVQKTTEVESELGMGQRAGELGYTAEQVLTVASILEHEVNRSADYPKAARVIYNRLQRKMPLQMDSTVAYVSKRKGDIFTTEAERQHSSAYNTYKHPGLPPAPIGSPGKETIQAALNPAEGDWLFFVADVEAGKTRFSSSLKEHNKWVKKLQEYCRQSDDC